MSIKNAEELGAQPMPRWGAYPDPKLVRRVSFVSTLCFALYPL